MKGGFNLSETAIGKYMIGAEIKVCGEKHGNGYIVESCCWHGVGSLEYRVEVMCVPVVADKGVNGKPKNGLGRIPLDK